MCLCLDITDPRGDGLVGAFLHVGEFLHGGELRGEATRAVDTGELVPDNLQVVTLYVRDLAVLDIQRDLGGGFQLARGKGFDCSGAGRFWVRRSFLAGRDAPEFGANEEGAHAHVPGQVIRLVEARHGGGVQYAGHGDDEGSGDHGSATAVTNEPKNERGGKGGRERESER